MGSWRRGQAPGDSVSFSLLSQRGYMFSPSQLHHELHLCPILPRVAQELFPLFSLGVTADSQFHTQLIWQPFEKGLHVDTRRCASGCFGLRRLYLTAFQKKLLVQCSLVSAVARQFGCVGCKFNCVAI